MSDRDHLEDVLFEFAAEPSHGGETLKRYLARHPDMADELVDLSFELRLREAATATSIPTDESWLDASWTAFERQTALQATLAPVADPFATATAASMAALRRDLGVPSAVIEGFRTRIVDATSVPERFLRALSNGLGSTLDTLRTFLAAPPRLAGGLSFKSDEAPKAAGGKIPFAQLLADARVPEADRARLLADAD